MIAHIRSTDGKQQSLREHCVETSRLCMHIAEKIECPNTARLIGLLHDLGKGTSEFKQYIEYAAQNPDQPVPKGIPHPNHAAAGAVFAYQRWYKGGPSEKITAQIISLCICGHHTGLDNCLNEKGKSNFLERLEKELQNHEKENYEQAVQYFLHHIADEVELDQFFQAACEEIKRKKIKQAFHAGMLIRLMLSILVDADRWNSACFEHGEDCFQAKEIPAWEKLAEQLNQYIAENFTDTSALSQVRKQISDDCAAQAEAKPGIYTLSVPTGGGKTLSSLRYALIHAAKHHKNRIFYVIPYNTILDQNAGDIREALADYPDKLDILEHHSNVVMETEEEQAAYKQLTERWDSDIILTSLVQFLNALFRGENTNARRMHRLTNAVIIFDEIQALPKQCKVLFEKAIQFLTQYCGSTVLLCTATQPEFTFEERPQELVENVPDLYHKLKRVTYIPQLKSAKDYAEAAEALSAFLDEGKSALMIVNTKAAAWEVFSRAKEILVAEGYTPVQICGNLSEEELTCIARETEENDILCVHLSTLMCPAHRKELIRQIKVWTKQKKPVLCVSTALIEAGINVSFPVVVRSLAGLPSIIQAAGRCNRNMEMESGEVYIWELEEERLNRLEDIQQGKNISRELICGTDDDTALDSQKMIQTYFSQEQQYRKVMQEFPYKEWGTTLYRMLSKNKELRNRASDYADNPVKKLVVYQSFHEAGKVFQVIDQQTKCVLVPYGEGAEIIVQLEGALDMKEEIHLLKKAQAYSVNLYENVFRRLNQENALVSVGGSGAIALRDGYYNADGGVCVEQQELEEMIF